MPSHVNLVYKELLLLPIHLLTSAAWAVLGCHHPKWRPPRKVGSDSVIQEPWALYLILSSLTHLFTHSLHNHPVGLSYEHRDHAHLLMPVVPYSYTPIALHAVHSWFFPSSLDWGPVIFALPSDVLCTSICLVFDADSWHTPVSHLTHYPTTSWTHPQLRLTSTAPTLFSRAVSMAMPVLNAQPCPCSPHGNVTPQKTHPQAQDTYLHHPRQGFCTKQGADGFSQQLINHIQCAGSMYHRTLSVQMSSKI